MVAQRGALPVGLVDRAPDQVGGRDIVAVAEDVGPDLDRLPGDPFDRISPRVDAGIDVFDPEPAAEALAHDGGVGLAVGLALTVAGIWAAGLGFVFTVTGNSP